MRKLKQPFSEVIFRFSTTEEERSKNKYIPHEYVISGPPNKCELWGWYGESHGWHLLTAIWQWYPVIVRLLEERVELVKILNQNYFTHDQGGE